MKFSLHVFKSRPLLYGGAFVLFFLVVLYFLNKSGGAAGGSTVVTNSGPTDAQLAAQVQSQANSLGAQVQLAEIQGQLTATTYQTDAATQALALQTNADLIRAHIDADTTALSLNKAVEAMNLQL